MTIWWISIVLQKSLLSCSAWPFYSCFQYFQCEIFMNVKFTSPCLYPCLTWDLVWLNISLCLKNITSINITMRTCCLRINKFTEIIFSFTKISKSQTTLISKVIRKFVGGSGGGFISTWTRINFDRLDFMYERELIVKGN